MLPKSRRLRLTRDFERVFAVRRAANGAFFRIKEHPNNLKTTRFAVVVSGKVHKRAVIRNRIRRRAWSVLRDLYYRVPSGHDIVIVALRDAATLDFETLKNDLAYLLTKRLFHS